MFYQDPFLLYQQSPFCHGSSTARNVQNRSSFRIDDILVPARQPFLVPKQPSFQEPLRSSIPNANPLKFGMHSILTQRQRDDVPMFQGGFSLSSCHYFARQNFIANPFVLKLNIFRLLQLCYNFAPCQVSCTHGF